MGWTSIYQLFWCSPGNDTIQWNELSSSDSKRSNLLQRLAEIQGRKRPQKKHRKPKGKTNSKQREITWIILQISRVKYKLQLHTNTSLTLVVVPVLLPWSDGFSWHATKAHEMGTWDGLDKHQGSTKWPWMAPDLTSRKQSATGHAQLLESEPNGARMTAGF